MGHCWAKLSHPYGQRSDADDSTTAKTELAGGNVHLVTTVDKWEKETSKANKTGKIVVVNFSASWCNPCRQIAPIYRELAAQYISILFLTVDVDDLAELTATWDIKATPTFFILKQGQQLDSLVGADKLELRKKIVAIAESNTSMTTPDS